MIDRFRHFAAIDWSGAAGERHKGIAIAICESGDAAPKLVRPAHCWSRLEALEWLRDDLPADTLVGMDIGTSFAFEDYGAYFPGWDESPRDAHALWALVERICAGDPYLGASSFVDHVEASRYFRRHGGREGDFFGSPQSMGRQGRFRTTEHAQKRMGCKPYSNFNLIGAAQVGKASLTAMRVLHRLEGHLPVWPIDPVPETGSVIVEIYAAIAAIEARRSASRAKIRTHADLNSALVHLGSHPVAGSGAIDDHKSDALLTAAWLRRAAPRAALWHPPALTPGIAAREGWTFGAA